MRKIMNLKRNIGEQFVPPKDVQPKTREEIGLSPVPDSANKPNVPPKSETPKKTQDSGSSPEKVRNEISTDFKPCTGFNQLGCKSESIKKVQKCLSLPESGNFDKTLYNALGQYGWQNGFNDSDTTRVCDLINRKKQENTKLEMDKKESEEFYKKFPKTTRGSEILDLS